MQPSLTPEENKGGGNT